MLCARTEAVRQRHVASLIEARPDMTRRTVKMAKADLIREVSAVKESIGFLMCEARDDVFGYIVCEVGKHVKHVYGLQDQRAPESLPDTGRGWSVNFATKVCGCCVFSNCDCCTLSVCLFGARAA
ncbi:hypothetical protein GN958_ATG05342 [Phytophthora infestans]|nr:hypothetical protein GN958_ATG12643 [Phytophthora infestans]KAF4145461.1 hypothetical protein GN958_ATG05342 [Phytophthora infestans]